MKETHRKTTIRCLAAGVTTAFVIGTAITAAPQASAGCVRVLPNEQVCDDPIQPDGTWKRCTFKISPTFVGPCTSMTDHELVPYGPPYHIDGPYVLCYAEGACKNYPF